MHEAAHGRTGHQTKNPEQEKDNGDSHQHKSGVLIFRNFELTGGFIDAFTDATNVLAKTSDGGTARAEGDNQCTGK